MNEEIKDFMKLCEVYDYEVIDNKYFVGKYKVLFGYRIRGGRLFSGMCDFDVCCGRSGELLELVKELYIKKVKKNISENKKFQKDLLGHSEIKPIFNDPKFMDWLTDLKTELDNEVTCGASEL
jgi:hypothetical protein